MRDDSAAIELVNKIGQDALSVVRICKNLESIIYNLVRLAKPNKKYFGIFSGLISTALILPLFYVISSISANFAIRLETPMIIYPSIVLALNRGSVSEP